MGDEVRIREGRACPTVSKAYLERLNLNVNKLRRKPQGIFDRPNPIFSYFHSPAVPRLPPTKLCTDRITLHGNKTADSVGTI